MLGDNEVKSVIYRPDSFFHFLPLPLLSFSTLIFSPSWQLFPFKMPDFNLRCGPQMAASLSFSLGLPSIIQLLLDLGESAATTQQVVPLFFL